MARLDQNSLPREEGGSLPGARRCWRHVSPCPQARRKAEPGKLLPSCHVWDPQVEPSCVPAAQHPYPVLWYPWENCTSPSQARRFSALTSLPGLDKPVSCAPGHSDWASVVM